MQLQDRLMARTVHVRNFSPIVHPSLTHRFCWTLFIEHVEEDVDEPGMVGFAGCVLMYLNRSFRGDKFCVVTPRELTT